MAIGFAVVVAVLLAASPAYGVNYIVGDNQGWTSGVDYSSWLSGKKFSVGDSLEFQYGPLHSVAEVSSSDYEACSASNSLQSFTDMDTKIPLTAAGSRYFICGTSGHCSGGMKLAVTVSAASDAAPSSPSTPASGSDASSSSPPSSNPSPPSSTNPHTTNNNNAAATVGSGGVLLSALLVGGVALMGW